MITIFSHRACSGRSQEFPSIPSTIFKVGNLREPSGKHSAIFGNLQSLGAVNLKHPNRIFIRRKACSKIEWKENASKLGNALYTSYFLARRRRECAAGQGMVFNLSVLGGYIIWGESVPNRVCYFEGVFPKQGNKIDGFSSTVFVCI